MPLHRQKLLTFVFLSLPIGWSVARSTQGPKSQFPGDASRRSVRVADTDDETVSVAPHQVAKGMLLMAVGAVYQRTLSSCFMYVPNFQGGSLSRPCILHVGVFLL